MSCLLVVVVVCGVDDGLPPPVQVPKQVTVTVTGNTGGEKYNGSEQTVTGYDVSIDNALYTVSDFTFSGNASASGTDAGTYNMGLAAEQFANTNDNFATVEFVVTDGSLTIEKRNVTMTSATDSKVYDKTALTNDTVTVTGDGFPMLKPGTTTIACAGNVQRIEVIPRWCCL